MEYICEQLSTPITDRCDVLVAGGGVAGIAAALAAARNGANVLLLEKQFMLGGLATAGLVTIYLPLCDGMGHQVTWGIAEELLKLSIRHGWEDQYPGSWLEGTPDPQRRYEVQYNPQLFALEAEALLLKEGVRILYGTSVCSVAVEDQRLNAVVIENKSGRSAIRVGAVIDCTGDADICAMSGEETALYGPGNILAAWHYYVNQDGYRLRIMGASDLPGTEELLHDGTFQGIDGQELSNVTLLSHRQILREVVSKQSQTGCYMPVTIATTPQVRMTRRLSGQYTASLTDERAHLSDSVGLFGNWKKRGPVYPLSYHSLHGNKIHNLLVAGRCISADDGMWDMTRVIPVCALSGQAAGTAAAMTHDFPNMDITALQDKLQQAGVRLWPEQIPGLD
jgi:hypothetical protein